MGLQILKFGQGKTRTEGGGFKNVESIFVDLQVYQTSSVEREGTSGDIPWQSWSAESSEQGI